MTGRWQVVCAEYSTPPVKDKATAERQRDAIDAGGHCRHAHEVISTTCAECAEVGYGTTEDPCGTCGRRSQ